MRFASCLIGLFLVVTVAPVGAQSWDTTTWFVVSEDGSELTGARAAHGQVFGEMLEQSSVWYRSLGFRAPDQERVPESPGGFLARVKDDPVGISSNNSWDTARDPEPRNWMYLTGNLGMTSPSTSLERLMWASPVHELFHAIQWSYPSYNTFGVLPQTLQACTPQGSSGASDAQAYAWFSEGTASMIQVRWIERAKGQPYQHHYRDASRASWVRFFDQPLNEPHLPASHLAQAFRTGESAAGRGWWCGYGTWYFWYAAGEMLAKQSGQEVSYLHYILDRPESWTGGGIEPVDTGLREAAAAFESPSRYDEGLYEIYPTFIAEYADDKRFYGQPDPVYLQGRTQVRWREGFIEPVATKAFEITVNVDDNIPPDESARVRVTLDPQPNRDQLHLIEGQRQAVRPLADEDPYTLELAVRKDTTLLVRLANVAEDASATLETAYRIRFELGGFYGALAVGPSITMTGDLPPGFTVLSGPPAIMGCTGTLDAGSVFDLVTADEAVGDIRRAFDRGELVLRDMEEAIEAEEIPIPNATARQREAFRRMMERDDAQAQQVREAMSQMKTDAAQAREENEDRRNTRGVEVTNKTAQRFAGRSRLSATFVGESGGKPCQVILNAVLEGEDGGAQVLGVRDSDEYESDGPFPIGIEDVNYIVGSIQEAPLVDDPFRVCMMTPEERAEEAQTTCPVLCTPGELRLETAEQGHIQGTFRAEMIDITDQMTPQGCPVVDRLELVFGFNITSANTGQDAEVMRSMSDEMLRQIGLSAEEISALRQFDSGDIR